MRERSRDRGRLEDIRQYALNVEKIIDGVTFAEFVDDISIYFSIMKNVEIIGEAANMLTKAFRDIHKEIPWRQIIDMRHVLVHGYAQVTNADLWDTATRDIKPLRQQVERYLKEIDWEEWEKGEDIFNDIDVAVYKKTIQTARKMKELGMAVDVISQVTGLSFNEIMEL